MEIQFTANSPEETRHIAEKLGKALHAGDCIAFFGGLGAGKTTFTHGLVAGLGLPDLVASPTFALVHEYHAAGCLSVYHFDMYRIHSEEELETTGFWDYPSDSAVFVIEWAENIVAFLPPHCIRVEITGSGESPRVITIKGEVCLDDSCS